jgi:hypothetical protein
MNEFYGPVALEQWDYKLVYCHKPGTPARIKRKELVGHSTRLMRCFTKIWKNKEL